MIDAHTGASSDTLYELGRLALTFALMGIGVWIFIKLVLRSGKRALRNKGNRQHRRAG